jgi:hypothetical protein
MQGRRRGARRGGGVGEEEDEEDKNIRTLSHYTMAVEIVMLEKLDCILSKRATRPIYMKVQVRLNAISPYQSQQSSLAIRDITVSGHTRHHQLRPYKTHLRLRPVYAIMATISISSSSRMTPPQTVCRHEHKLETQCVSSSSGSSNPGFPVYSESLHAEARVRSIRKETRKDMRRRGR